jgi:hypothetical protein
MMPIQVIYWTRLVNTRERKTFIVQEEAIRKFQENQDEIE